LKTKTREGLRAKVKELVYLPSLNIEIEIEGAAAANYPIRARIGTLRIRGCMYSVGTMHT
jgi:hypothetical protein